MKDWMIAKFPGTCPKTGNFIYPNETRITYDTIFQDWVIYDDDDVDDLLPANSEFILASSSPNFDYEEGIEYLEHFVTFCDEDGEPIGRTWLFETSDEAESFGERLAERFTLPLEVDFLY